VLIDGVDGPVIVYVMEYQAGSSAVSPRRIPVVESLKRP
jgi:hypothetical protein